MPLQSDLSGIGTALKREQNANPNRTGTWDLACHEHSSNHLSYGTEQNVESADNFFTKPSAQKNFPNNFVFLVKGHRFRLEEVPSLEFDEIIHRLIFSAYKAHGLRVSGYCSSQKYLRI